MIILWPHLGSFGKVVLPRKQTVEMVINWNKPKMNKQNRNWIFALNFHLVWKYIANKAFPFLHNEWQ